MGVSDDPVLTALGWDATLAEWSGGLPAGATVGRVGRADRGFCFVLTTGDPVQAEIGPGFHAVTGDWVAVSPDGRVAAVAPRRGSLARADAHNPGVPQVLAANVDFVFVVCGADRPLRPGRLERALALAWDGDTEPVLVLTKADVAGAGDMAADAAAAAPGVAVHLTSALTGEGLGALHDLLGGSGEGSGAAGGSGEPEAGTSTERRKTAALLGESGAGKSTLANRLAGVDLLATGAVRKGDFKGRHTTTARYLVVLPGGGILIDTPGLRGIGLPGGAESLATVFADVEALAADCRFSDCAHRSEPGCAVQAAVADGRLAARRVEGLEKLLREAEHAEGAVAAHERRAQNRQFGKVAREAQRAKQQGRPKR